MSAAFPFHFLPAEILDHILLLASLDDPPRPGVYDHDRRVFYNEHKSDHTGRLSNEVVWRPVLERGSLGWIKLSHVCRVWRDALIARKSLWAESLGLLPMAEGEMFRRAGTWCPFDVTVTAAPFHRHDSTVLQLFKASKAGTLAYPSSIRDRLRSLHLVDMREAFGGHLPLDELFSTVLFGLEELGIHFSGPTEETIWFAGDPSIIIEAPNLHTLRLTNGFVRWRSTKLRSFSLNCYNGPVPSRDLLLEFMHNLPETVEELELLHCFCRDFGLEAQAQLSTIAQLTLRSQEKIVFPRLRTLHLADDRDSMAGFLIRAAPPPTAHITVELYVEIENGEWATDDQKEGIERNIKAALLCGKFGPNLDGLVLRPGAKKDEFIVDLYTDSLACFNSHSTPSSEPFTTNQPSLTLSVLNAASIRSRDLDTAFLSIASTLNPMRFTTMSIDIPHWRPKEIIECMKPFKSLRALRIVDPLDRRNLPRVPDTALPYLSALDTVTEDELKLGTLWLVQRQRLYDFSYLSWALILSRQLRVTFARADEKPFRLKVLRVDYLVEIKREDTQEVARGRQTPKELFEEFADMVEWGTGVSEAGDRVVIKGKGEKDY